MCIKYIFKYTECNDRQDFIIMFVTEIQRKPLTDIFEQESQLIHPEPKLPTLDTAALNAKWKAAQAAR